MFYRLNKKVVMLQEFAFFVHRSRLKLIIYIWKKVKQDVLNLYEKVIGSDQREYNLMLNVISFCPIHFYR